MNNDEQNAELRLVMPMSTFQKVFGEQLMASDAHVALLNDVQWANKRVADAESHTKLAEAALRRFLENCTCGRNSSPSLSPHVASHHQIKRYASSSQINRY